jgi:hypothetical protein
MSRTSKLAENLRGRVTKGVISYAFFRLESAIIIALIIILVFLIPQPFPWWRWWFWLVVCVVAEGLIVYTTVSDPNTARQVMTDMFRQEFNPRAIRSKKYRERLEKALTYRDGIESTVRTSRAGVLRDHLEDTADSVADWVANVFRLARRLDAYERDEVIQQDLRSVPLALKNLQDRLKQEEEETVRQQIQETIASKKAHQQNLKKLQNTMEKAEFLLERTLSDLGTIYSQLQQIEARDVESGRAQRLTEDVANEIADLQGIVDAMDQVYSYKD